MERLIVYQFKVTRNYEETPNYMIFESGHFNKPLLILSEIEATRLRDDLDVVLAMVVPTKKRTGWKFKEGQG